MFLFSHFLIQKEVFACFGRFPGHKELLQNLVAFYQVGLEQHVSNVDWISFINALQEEAYSGLLRMITLWTVLPVLQHVKQNLKLFSLLMTLFKLSFLLKKKTKTNPKPQAQFQIPVPTLTESANARARCRAYKTVSNIIKSQCAVPSRPCWMHASSPSSVQWFRAALKSTLLRHGEK